MNDLVISVRWLPAIFDVHLVVKATGWVRQDICVCGGDCDRGHL
jgi:hypothetical protein